MSNLLQKKQHLTYFLLGVIVLFAAFLRFFDVSNVPVSLYWDETASTYNAYSIALTGKDEYGIAHPLLFKSFDDYKASGNIYVTAIAVMLFGLNEFSARFTSGLAGTLTVLLTFFVMQEVFYHFKKKDIPLFHKNIPIHSEVLSLLVSFFLAISPWHIQFSRTGFEANVAIVFTIGGLYFLLHSLRLGKAWFYYLAMSLFSLGFYFYRSIWVFLPMLLVIIFFYLRKELFSKTIFKQTLLGVALFLLVLAPLIPVILSPQGLKRAQQVNVFTNSSQQLITAAQKRLQGGVVAKSVYNQRIIIPEIIIGNYFSNFSPQFLFTSGDPEGRHGPRGMGVLYFWEVPFILLGLYIVWRYFPKNLRNIIIFWLVISPLPAAFSTPNPHALRDLNVLPLPQIFTALGVYVVYYLFIKKFRFIYVGILSVIVVSFFAYYLYLYYGVTAKATSADWADGYKELAQYMIPRENQYQKLVVSGHYWQPYIYFLFYKQYSPALYQKSGNQYAFGKYVFGGTAWDKDKGKPELDNVNLQKFAGAKHILVALSPEEYETEKNSLNYLTTIKNHNGEVVFIIGDME